MPYELKGDCVHKVGEDKPLKCYPGNKEAAKKYLAALEANVPDANKSMKKAFQGMLEQSEVNYVALSTTKGKACANCRWFMNNGCFIVESYDPEPIIATGYCDRWEATPPPAPDLEDAIVEAVSEAVTNVTGAITDALPTPPMMDMGKELFATPSDSLLVTLQKRLRGGSLKPDTRILKDNAGRRYMFMVTSNGYKDGDGDHVATKALQEYVDHTWTKGNEQFIGDNAHYIWHTKELGSISDLVFADVWSGFLVELWREKSANPIAKGFYNYVEKHSEIEWGASHGFSAARENGVFKHIDKTESSTLPLVAASNLLTLSEVLPMVEKGKRDAFLNTLFKEEFGIEDAAGLLKQGPEKLRAELAARGVEAKALGEGSSALKEAKAETLKASAELMLSMVEVQDQFDKQLEEIKELHTKELAAKDIQIKALGEKFETETAAWQKSLDGVLAIVNAGPRRASQDIETVLKDTEKPMLKDKLPDGNPADSFWTSMGIPMKGVTS